MKQRKIYCDLSWIEKILRHMYHPVWYCKAKWWKFKHWFFINQPSKFNILCFKIQIPYWKLLFKYKYHSNYREAELGEWKKYHKKHFGKELNVRGKRKIH